LAGLLAAATVVAGAERLTRRQPWFGTFVTVTVFGEDPALLATASSQAFAVFQRLDGLLSAHRRDSELSRLNATASTGPVEVSGVLWEVINAAQTVAQQTGGCFDITVLPLTQAWGFLWKEHRFPSAAERAELLTRTGYRNLECDPASRTVRFRVEGMGLDLGAIAKGYAVDCAVDGLRAAGIEAGMVNAGGDLRVFGRPPGQAGWPVQLEDPLKLGTRETIEVVDTSISTSGDYENGFDYEDRRYGHTLDPRTGMPVEGVAACTVLAPTCLESDALATAFIVHGVEPSLRDFGKQYPIRFVIRSEGPAEGLEIRATPFFPRAQ